MKRIPPNVSIGCQDGIGAFPSRGERLQAVLILARTSKRRFEFAAGLGQVFDLLFSDGFP